MRWELTGVPYTSMKEPGGIARAISVLRAEGLAERLAEVGVGDAGDLALAAPDGDRGPSGLLNEAALTRLVEATRQHVRDAVEREVVPLLVGGDCPVALGPLAALRDAGAKPALVLLDGHEDGWPPGASPTGEASDSEVAIALGRVDALPPALERLVPLIGPAALAMFGPRDAAEIAEAGIESLRGRTAFFLSGEEVGGGGEAAAQMRQALGALDADSFWLHVDLDVLSSTTFPAVDYPQAGGLAWPQLDELALAAAHDPGCRGISVVIYNPDLDPGLAGARDLIRFLVRLGTGRAQPPGS